MNPTIKITVSHDCPCCKATVMDIVIDDDLGPAFICPCDPVNSVEKLSKQDKRDLIAKLLTLAIEYNRYGEGCAYCG